MTSPTKAAELADLIAWHEGQSCHARYAANAGTAVKHEEPRKSMLLKQAEFHDKAAALLRASEGRAPEIDDLAQFIRQIDGNHTMGAGVMAERICDWLTAAPHPPAQQAEPNGSKFFSYDADNGFERHETEAQAKAAARVQLGIYRDESSIDGGWDDDVEQVCWGVIVERTRPVPQIGPEYPEEGCDFLLKPYSPPPHKAEGAEPQKGGV